MTRSTPIVFFGSDNFSEVILEGLLAREYRVGLVVTNPPPKKPGGQSELGPVLALANRHGIEAITPSRLDNSVVSCLTKTRSEYAVLASYGKLLPSQVLDVFQAIINVHPSLLPRWRGPSPVEAAILAGDAKTGVSLMKLVTAMDAGPIYAQAEYPLAGIEDQPGLTHQLAESGRDLLLDKLPAIVSGQLSAKDQTEQAASYCPLISKPDGWLDWRQPATNLERKVRAYRVWPKARAEVLGRDIIVTQAEVVPGSKQVGRVIADGQRLLVECGQDTLSILRLKPAGKAEMSATEFMRGLKH